MNEKELDRLLKFLGLAKKAGKVITGDAKATNAIKKCDKNFIVFDIKVY